MHENGTSKRCLSLLHIYIRSLVLESGLEDNIHAFTVRSRLSVAYVGKLHSGLVEVDK